MIAITRKPSSTLADCELTYLDRVPIDLPLAQRQHDSYCDALRTLGVEVITLPAEDHLPDAVFVEDTAVVVDEVAVIGRPGAQSRRPEIDTVRRVLEAYRPLVHIEPPGLLDGGDVIRIGRTLFVGAKHGGPPGRTNAEGMDQLRRALSPYGYRTVPVRFDGCLHLKTGTTYAGRDTVLIRPDLVDATPFRSAECDAHEVSPHEPGAANVLRVGEEVLASASAPSTAGYLRKQGFSVLEVDISEMQKAEAGLTCMSLIIAT